MQGRCESRARTGTSYNLSGVPVDAGDQIAHVAEAPAIAHRSLGYVPTLERSSFCSLAPAGVGDSAHFCQKVCNRISSGIRVAGSGAVVDGQIHIPRPATAAGNAQFSGVTPSDIRQRPSHRNAWGSLASQSKPGACWRLSRYGSYFKCRASWAEMQLNQRTEREFAFHSRRLLSNQQVIFNARYRGLGPTRRLAEIRSGSLEYFLTERYCLFSRNRAGEAVRANIHTVASPLEDAEAEIERNDLPAVAGITDSGARAGAALFATTRCVCVAGCSDGPGSKTAAHSGGGHAFGLGGAGPAHG